MYEVHLNTPYVLRTKIKHNIWIHTTKDYEDNIVIETCVDNINMGTRLSQFKLSQSWAEIDTNENKSMPQVILLETKYLKPPTYINI
jgi:hypothetical protein